jgi:peptidoglycan/xylan/chitin deacetylase (PgdA/CDA1 family)
MSDVLVLCYHAVSEDWTAPLSVTPESLERQLSLLRSLGYEGARFLDAVISPPATRTVVITFDDAYRNVATLAFPILARLGFPGTVFVPTSFAGSEQPMCWPGIDQWMGGPHERELIPLDWDELRELRRNGWEVGSHTRTHPHLPEVPDDVLDDELRRSREECADMMGEPCRTLAYPYGAHDPRVVAATATAGYDAAATLSSRLQSAEPLRWPRVGIYHSDGRTAFRLKATRTVRLLRRTPMADQLIRIRRRLRGETVYDVAAERERERRGESA